MKRGKKVLRRQKRQTVPKECYFCKAPHQTEQGKEQIEPYFKDVEILQRFLTERGKIMPRVRNGLCAKHQKALTLNIKYARHLSLLPFLSR